MGFFINALFFNPARRRKICDILLLLVGGAVCTSLGLMFVGSSRHELQQTQAILPLMRTLSVPSTLDIVFIAQGDLVGVMIETRPRTGSNIYRLDWVDSLSASRRA
ncbi:hypothetical protein NA57DRAFT_62208 [Rhizodiscina lignyota]|uniref:Uncharacterized protein n=1 Tax=Rhizodiscina lignyota TaxID=1504668 RepID=A0A9P4I2Y8_9PEZI|nr:hypothetical protein NA57DRAFT_62208 [Rhizodiscina lignyota]